MRSPRGKRRRRFWPAPTQVALREDEVRPIPLALPARRSWRPEFAHGFFLRAAARRHGGRMSAVADIAARWSGGRAAAAVARGSRRGC